jgi:predicted house-cleaning noncanonical NTP pyrophosphatase (MazG superfamily)
LKKKLIKESDPNNYKNLTTEKLQEKIAPYIKEKK